MSESFTPLKYGTVNREDVTNEYFDNEIEEIKSDQEMVDYTAHAKKDNQLTLFNLALKDIIVDKN